MTENIRKDFCVECRKMTEYVLKTKNIKKVIREKEYSFDITIAVCAECGGEMGVPGLIDQNIKEVDEQYRAAEGLVAIDDIYKMMSIYHIGKAPLSLALGFGEVTIARYLSGQIPSKEYSDVIRNALSSPSYMKQLLIQNREKIAGAAFHKAMNAVSGLECLFSVSDRMLRVIAYIFEKLEEVTPLMLQKLLYFSQGLSLILYKEPLFEEDCEAWVHGPVYPKVYNLFKDFKYNPIDDARFAVLYGKVHELTSREQEVLDLVIASFGLYSGKALEKITHNEQPWKIARKGCGDGILSNEVVKKETMASYYSSVNQKYDLGTCQGLKKYIQSMLELS